MLSSRLRRNSGDQAKSVIEKQKNNYINQNFAFFFFKKLLISKVHEM